ncbi:MAG TPA: nuclear transport factor 2 family protein [Acidobacteriota bacterium]|nr:nuclear transport factor 2 family protein [Acidobacteriota bacterium]
MDFETTVKEWFDKWESGDFLDLPLSDTFKHTSPFGTVEGKETYLDQVKANQDKFLGYRFEIHDALYGEDRACVRYTAIQGDFRLDVSEWHYGSPGGIEEIVAYYHIGEIREDRKLADV